ncbi:MAG: FAD:protein FMN transferase [Acidobacteriota bacterium]
MCRTLTWTLICLAALAACRDTRARPHTITLGGPTMGAAWSVQIVTGPEGLSNQARASVDAAIRDQLARITALMSTWNPESELSRFNRSTSLDPFPLAPETFDVFQWAVDLSEQTGGAFDVTVAPLVEAWGFGPPDDGGGPGASSLAPADTTLARLREATGVRHLHLDKTRRTVQKRRPDVRCDFSGLAPGYAADRIAALLSAHGIANALVDVGGELVARGTNESGAPWQVAIEDPGVEGGVLQRVVALSGDAMATSGDYRNYREVNGRRLAHIVDPATGRPIEHRLASATVIDTLGVRADALATALMVLGPERGMVLAERLGLPALLIVRTPDGRFEQRASSRFNTRQRH